MKWVLKDPSYSDMIRFKMGNFYHYGIFVSEDEVIQFGLAPIARPNIKACDVEVCVSDIDTFLCGGFLEVGVPEKKELKKLRSPDQIVSAARARLGEKNYNVIHNNCEHFAYECTFGEKYCSQTDTVRELFKHFPIVNVYVSAINYDTPISNFSIKAIDSNIRSCNDEKLKYQKYFEWKLLEYALDHTFRKALKKLDLERSENDSWKCDFCEFAFAHSDDVVATVISRRPVKISLSKENTTIPSENDWQREFTVKNNKYIISVSSESIDRLKFYENCELK